MICITRRQVIRGTFLLIGLVFLVRLLFIQLLSEWYTLAAEKNIVQATVAHPYRGEIYDRHGELLACNAPIFDLMVVPRAVKRMHQEAFCRDFGLTPEALKQGLRKARRYSHVKPSVFMKSLSPTTLAQVQDRMDAYPGFFINARTVRQYPHPFLAHTLGYMGEIGAQQLAADTTDYYQKGDWIGVSGLEKCYEAALRGERGIYYRITNAKGVARGSFREGALDRLAVPGKALWTTIDTQLQLYGERLMQHKTGSIVALVPETGEILALISSPTYDPNSLVGRSFGKNFIALERDKLAPLFHRSIMAMYPPGSIFKLVQSLVALQEGLIQPSTTYACNRRLVNCHYHPSPTALHEAIKYSCNPYFYYVFKKLINQQLSDNTYEDTRLGLEKWAEHLYQFGFGAPLGIDLPGEKGGHVPRASFYDTLYGAGRWKLSTIRSLDIGQGELLLTPLQMANLAAIIANRGYYRTPHLVRQVGEAQLKKPQEHMKHEVGIAPTHFALVAEAMQAGVKEGTSRRVRVNDIAICAKTGTAENPHGEDHSICIAFAPHENPQIALAVCVENAGWGGRAAASIAGLMVEQYIKGKTSRPWIQNYVLKGDFFH